MGWLAKNTQKITFRLTLKYTLFFTITLIAMSGITLFSVKYYIYNQSYQQVVNIAVTVKQMLQSQENLTNSDLAEISQMNQNIDLNIRRDHQIIFSTPEAYNLDLPSDETAQPISIEHDETHLIYFNDQMMNGSGQNLQIQVIKDMDNEREFIKILFWILLVINGLAFWVSILLGFMMSKRALRPIETITRQAKTISIQDLTKRINIEGPDDELKRLAETFNNMIIRIHHAYEKQNRFALDASHELATPLSVMKGYVDIMSRWGKDDPAVLEEGIEAIKREVANMTKLLDTLLFLAKNDNDVTQLEKKEFWLNELIIEVVKENKMVYQDKIIRSEINQSILIYGDRRLIKQMIRAIVDNSVKYTGEDGQIIINSRVLKDMVQICITDNGIGIPPTDLPHIFDRFYRVDQARTRDSGGSGLGLSIVKWIADLHCGTVRAESESGQGTTITIELPINNQSELGSWR